MATSRSVTAGIHSRRALVIGNNIYRRYPLNNCVNDAQDLAVKLRAMNFTVELGINCNHEQMRLMVHAFVKTITDQDLVLFYFAGHGLQHKHRNYLLPVDAEENIKQEESIEFHAINAQEVLHCLSSKRYFLTIFILDCCRTYWFGFQEKHRGGRNAEGLHPMNPPGGTILQFACAPGTVSRDGCDGERNGLFTKCLLEHIDTPNKDIEKVLNAVCADVRAKSGDNQIPHRVCTSTIDELIYLESSYPEQISAKELPPTASNHQRLPNLEGDKQMRYPPAKTKDRGHNWLTKLVATMFISNSAACHQNLPEWSPNGVRVAGDYGYGDALYQLCRPYGFYVDDGKNVIVADRLNHRVVEWSFDTSSRTVLVGANGQEDRFGSLNQPTDVIVDENDGSLIVCDWGNRRVMRRSRHDGTKNGETIIDGIGCWGVAMDHERSLYIADSERHEVRRYRRGETHGTVVAGGNGAGDSLCQLDSPHYVCLDPDGAIYVSDNKNHRVMKWEKDAREGIIVAGGQGPGNGLNQLHHPEGVLIDEKALIYVADYENSRVMRWCCGTAGGTVVVGDKQRGSEASQLHGPTAVFLDRQFNLYVVDSGNNRVQWFSIKKS